MEISANQTNNPQPQVEATPSKLARWKKTLHEWEGSGESQPKFCEKRGISYAQFCYWRSKASKVESRENKGALLPVNVVSNKNTGKNSSVVISLPNGINLNITSTVDKSTLSTILSLLGVSI